MQTDSSHPQGKETEDLLLNTMRKLAIDDTTAFKKKPVIIFVVGMSGSGKTTFMNLLVCHARGSNIQGYVINLDPAIMTLPYGANIDIDIRDTVKYKEVMKQYNPGPNGGILTSLNLFATKFDEVVSFTEKRADQLDYVLVDTLGQIEIFTWSASGSIITEAFASTFPTVIACVVDTPRSSSPTDVARHEFTLETFSSIIWIRVAEGKILTRDGKRSNGWKRNTDSRLGKDMEKSGGESVVLSIGLKDKSSTSKSMMDEDEDEEDEDWEDEDWEDDFVFVTQAYKLQAIPLPSRSCQQEFLRLSSLVKFYKCGLHRKEHERVDSSASVSGATGSGNCGSGSRPTSSGMGWSKFAPSAFQEKDAGDDRHAKISWS
ncbi:hypothetical protein C5167_031258 [Papaver somniferum]|nr:hypothetical protein C5167_031258 [Papaver somniferum]